MIFISIIKLLPMYILNLPWWETLQALLETISLCKPIDDCVTEAQSFPASQHHWACWDLPPGKPIPTAHPSTPLLGKVLTQSHSPTAFSEPLELDPELQPLRAVQLIQNNCTLLPIPTVASLGSQVPDDRCALIFQRYYPNAFDVPEIYRVIRRWKSSWEPGCILRTT